jgi:hypothetical protein
METTDLSNNEELRFILWFFETHFEKARSAKQQRNNNGGVALSDAFEFARSYEGICPYRYGETEKFLEDFRTVLRGKDIPFSEKGIIVFRQIYGIKWKRLSRARMKGVLMEEGTKDYERTYYYGENDNYGC